MTLNSLSHEARPDAGRLTRRFTTDEAGHRMPNLLTVRGTGKLKVYTQTTPQEHHQLRPDPCPAHASTTRLAPNLNPVPAAQVRGLFYTARPNSIDDIHTRNANTGNGNQPSAPRGGTDPSTDHPPVTGARGSEVDIPIPEDHCPRQPSPPHPPQQQSLQRTRARHKQSPTMPRTKPISRSRP